MNKIVFSSLPRSSVEIQRRRSSGRAVNTYGSGCDLTVAEYKPRFVLRKHTDLTNDLKLLNPFQFNHLPVSMVIRTFAMLAYIQAFAFDFL